MLSKPKSLHPSHLPFRAGSLARLAMVVALGAALAACGAKDKKPGQSLASVNGEEITVLQLNEEMQRSGVAASQQEAASKQLLQALIDRQLLQSAGVADKVDRDPKVVQAIERAKALLIAQAYLQKRMGTISPPTAAEVQAYFDKNPDYFSRRKQLDLRELVISTSDLDAKLKAAMDATKSLDDVATWLDANKVKYVRTQVSRTTSDLPPALASSLLAMPKGQLFVIKEGDRSLLISIADIKDAPVTLEVAAPQIQQFLTNEKTKEASTAEISRLRATAKIEYLNPKLAPAATAPAPDAAAAAGAPPAGAAPAASGEVNARGVAGLK